MISEGSLTGINCMNKNNKLLFTGSDSSIDNRDSSDQMTETEAQDNWKLLIVDDEPEVHEITKLALLNFSFENKGLEYLHAYSAAEALELLKIHQDIALILLDVVMETDHAGLDLIRQIREDLDNHVIRIVLRTGQPGEAPQREVIVKYDINDYTEKTDLSAKKLFTVVVASLRAYRDMLKLEDSRSELLLSNRHLAQERERIQVTLDSIGDAVLTTDAAGLVTHMNPIAESLTGWSIEQAEGKTLTDIFKIINAESRLPVDNPVARVLASGNIVGLANHTVLVSRQSKEYQIADSAAPIRNDVGEILGVILVFHDVTQQYQTEQALRRSQKMEAIGQLTGGIAHDFNNQLGVIIGYLDFLRDYVANAPKPLKWVETSTNAALRCTDLTRQLLSFSRTQSNEKTVININLVLQELQTMFARSVTPEVDVQYALADNLWQIEVDNGEFQDAVLNLVINARDAMPGGGILSIETCNELLDSRDAVLNPDIKPGEYVLIKITDNGCGMDKNTQEHLFEPFYTTKPKGKGTGLGMSMVYGFVMRFCGFINIDSELHQGTSMSLYLPRATAVETEIVSSEQKAETQYPSGHETILIVDDEIDLLHLADKYLTELGYRTYLAENAAQAMEVLMRQKGIDLLFTDVVMPGGINGYELATRAVQQQRHLKVLLTSGFTSKTMSANVQQKFAHNLLNKPYRKVELAQKLRTVFDE